MSLKTRKVRIGSIEIGGGLPVAVQSMCATHTRDVDPTVAVARALTAAGAGVVRIAVDSDAEAEALAEIRKQTKGAVNLSVDLQESWRLATKVAPHVDKIRYNPGHLHHHEKDKPTREKVAFIIGAARDHGCAVRIGVNCGSVDPEVTSRHPHDSVAATVESALAHCDILDGLKFDQYVVSIKDSDPRKVVEANRAFSRARPDVPIHLGVTEAGLPPGGVVKTRMAFEPLLTEGIGDTLRVSLTVPCDRKTQEIEEGLRILADVKAGRLTSKGFQIKGLNIISCPSCSRVENEEFVHLAERVVEMAQFAKDSEITIAVMGCRVNGPGETDDADLGLWCGPTHVNLKRGPEKLGSFTYTDVLIRLKVELEAIVKRKGGAPA
ncbi:MAG: (E)-4-hydroxy-3-methylbut-2-enyl-diphosphate synthase [Candidatus Coatesbacteria bacterium]